MSDLILDSRTRTVDDSLRETVHAGLGYKIVYHGAVLVASDSDDDWARVAKFVRDLHAARKIGGRLALLGGGMCCLPAILHPESWHCDVYEQEPVLERYQPRWCRFIPGRWQDTFAGEYDVIVLDTGEQLDERERTILREHLAGGGLLIPEQEV